MTRLLQVARPQFLITGLALFAFGASWAILLGAPFSLSRLLLGYLVLLPAHLSISYSNDYFDLDVDKLGKPTLFSGGSGVLVDHGELRKPAKWIAIALILCSLGLAVLFQVRYSVPSWFLGFVVVGNLLGWFYAAPPLRLAYRGLGELSTALTVGLLLPGMGYLIVTGTLNGDGLLFTIPLMLYGLAFILTVEIPDEEADRLGDKRTWVARRGRGFGFTVVGISLLLATLSFFCFSWLYSRTYPLDFRLLGLLSLLPLGAGVIGMVGRPVERQPAIKVVDGIVISLAVFCVLVDGYLVYLATR
jgi:1,4-dihydroxy-2-naphthoate octaprenyltransferase